MPNRSPLSLTSSQALLGLSKWPVTYEELSSAYRTAAKKYHPDRGGSDQEMKDVNAAYELLKKELERIPIGSRSGSSNTGEGSWGHATNWWNTAGAWSSPFTNTNWDDIWRAADEFAREQNERHRQQAEREREEFRRRQENQTRTERKPEEHKYTPPKNPQEAFDRAKANTKEAFCILEHWQPSKSKPGNITRLFTNLGGLRCTIYWSAKEGLYRWSSYLGPDIPTAFSQRSFSSRKEAVENLAKILFEKVEGEK